MIKYLAYCDDPIVFLNNASIDPVKAENYPGLQFIPILAEKLEENGLKLETADISLQRITKGKCKPQEVGLIVAGSSRLGDYLIKLGVVPLIIFSGESPLWMADLYGDIEKFTKRFRSKVLFSGVFKQLNDKSFQHFYFPSYDSNSIIKLEKHPSNKISLVVSNKYVNVRSKGALSVKNLAKIILGRLAVSDFFNARKKRKKELQTKRLEMINFFLESDLLSLYGKGWDNLSNLPEPWRTRLDAKINKAYNGLCDNKKETISKYRFNLCLENFQYPGYITEKIIDCFAANTVPLYLGAPDIENYIPLNCFIDLRKFKSNSSLLKFLNGMTDDEYNQILNNGKAFLLSDEGKKYSYSSVANQFYKLIMECIK